jgi:glyoxylase-like metal-dependent hydrolase (beta-lactamase superfamily II)
VVPKSLWQRTNPADEKNLCPWSMRSMLIEDGERLILIDTGIGKKQDEKFFGHFNLHGNHSLDAGLKDLGFHRDQITDVFLTHLHFDHCGGAIERNSNGTYAPAFKNATFWSNQDHWNWATKPNAREKASFLSENILPIQESGQLQFLKRDEKFRPEIELLWVDGHTDAQMIPHITYKGKTLVFMADLLPSTGHIPLPYVMGYDTRPLLTLDEKGKFLKEAAEKEYILFLEHDYYNECCTVFNENGRVKLKDTFSLNEAFGK